MRPTLKTTLAAALVLILCAAPGAQAPKPFTAQDMLDVSSASVLDLSEDGRHVAVSVRRPFDNAETDHRRYGDPTYVAPSRVKLLVIDTRTGDVRTPFPGLVNVRAAAWARDGQRLAILTMPDGAAGTPPALHIWDAERAALTVVPAEPSTRIAAGSDLEWSADGTRIFVSLRSPDRDRAAAERFRAVTEGPVVVHSSKEPFLEWDELRREPRHVTVAALDPGTGRTTTLLPERRVASYRVTRDSKLVTFMEDVTEKTDYEVIAGTTSALRAVGDGASEPRTIVDAKDLKGVQPRWSDDGRMFAYAKNGEVFVQGVDEEKPRSLTPRPKEEKPDEAAPAGPGTDKPRPESFSPSLFSRDGSKLLITSRKGWYVANVADGKRMHVLALDEAEEEPQGRRNPRISPIAWSLEGDAIYVTWSAADRWDRGVMRLPLGRPAAPPADVLEPLVRDARLYSGVRMSRDGSTFVLAISDGDRPADLYVADSRFTSVKRLTDLNPWLADRALPRSELVAYRDVDGRELYGVLRYPAGYVKGQKYPTVFEIYETFFDNGFNARAAFLTNHGYAVFHPSVNLVVGRPGEAWVKGVTSAANRLIEMGIADPDRLGVHGTSYGGYATVLLITQTDRFKAAINISGKVNMISFYTDSPRLGVRNTHAPEKSQDRIGGTLWEYPERYLDHSAILHADRIKTPLLTISGDQDPNVPASQSREIYYALRRLGKEVEWVRYVNGGHRPPNSVSEATDFEQRILAWYDRHLKAESKKKTTDSQGQ
ncbi:MAG TPA: prolyl oligopeptidase family serine peptidase [Vicinamibacterales bacterium]|nr:prolyl oligopeptidase family serine peptidase [Vicinamibacterales bacterium]